MVRWQIFSAVALRKLPDLMPRPTALESKVQEIFNAREVAFSKLSDHELGLLKVKGDDEESEDVIVKETAQDREDRWIREKSSFQFGQYEDRLSCSQLLFVNTEFGTDIKKQWLLPQAAYDSKQDEFLTDTARRALKETLNVTSGFKIFSRVPSSSLRFRYPAKARSQTGYDGAIVFFVRAILDVPERFKPIDGSKKIEMQWLTRQEAEGLVHKDYMNALGAGLLSEERRKSQALARLAKRL